jgi:hypothetical protein
LLINKKRKKQDEMSWIRQYLRWVRFDPAELADSEQSRTEEIRVDQSRAEQGRQMLKDRWIKDGFWWLKNGWLRVIKWVFMKRFVFDHSPSQMIWIPASTLPGTIL